MTGFSGGRSVMPAKPRPGDHRNFPGQEALQVHARAEAAARAGEHEHPDVVAGVEFVDGRRYAARHLAVDRVARLAGG